MPISLCVGSSTLDEIVPVILNCGCCYAANLYELVKCGKLRLKIRSEPVSETSKSFILRLYTAIQTMT